MAISLSPSRISETNCTLIRLNVCSLAELSTTQIGCSKIFPVSISPMSFSFPRGVQGYFLCSRITKKASFKAIPVVNSTVSNTSDKRDLSWEWPSSQGKTSTGSDQPAISPWNVPSRSVFHLEPLLLYALQGHGHNPEDLFFPIFQAEYLLYGFG